MIPGHVRRCYVGTLGGQLAHLAVDVARVAGYGVSGGPKKAMGVTGRPRVIPAPVPRVVAPSVTVAARKRILARAGSTYREKQGDLARELGLSVSMVKMVRMGERGGCSV